MTPIGRSPSHTRGLLAGAMVALLICSGCQAWQSQVAVPGLGVSSKERQIVKQAKRDPFPSPAEVGMK